MLSFRGIEICLFLSHHSQEEVVHYFQQNQEEDRVWRIYYQSLIVRVPIYNNLKEKTDSVRYGYNDVLIKMKFKNATMFYPEEV